MDRRKMLGATLGGVAAAPDMAKAALAQEGITAETAIGYGSAQAAKPAMHQQYILEDLAKLKRIAAGDIRKEDENNHLRQGPPPSFASLRSVSDEARHFMCRRQEERKWRERMIESAIQRLEEYEKTGLLRHITPF